MGGVWYNGRANNDPSNPWADKCGYLQAAGKTLPLFKWMTADAHTHSYGYQSDADQHWYACACGVEQTRESHDFTWIIDRQPGSTTTGSKHEQCRTYGYQKAAVTIPSTGTNIGPAKNPYQKDENKKTDTKKTDGKTVKSGDTGDMGMALYGDMALLSLTGGAWIVGKNRK